MDIFQKAQQLAQDYLKGFSTADALQVRMLQQDTQLLKSLVVQQALVFTGFNLLMCQAP